MAGSTQTVPTAMDPANETIRRLTKEVAPAGWLYFSGYARVRAGG